MDFKSMSPEWKEKVADIARGKIDRMDRQNYSVFKIILMRFDSVRSTHFTVAQRMEKDGSWIKFFDKNNEVCGIIRTKDIHSIFKDSELTYKFRNCEPLFGEKDKNLTSTKTTSEEKIEVRPEWLPKVKKSRPSWIPENVSNDVIVRIFASVYDSAIRQEVGDYIDAHNKAGDPKDVVMKRPSWIPVEVSFDVICGIYAAVFCSDRRKELEDYFDSLYHK